MRGVQDNLGSSMALSVHELKGPSDFNRSRIPIQRSEFNPSEYDAEVQVVRPFAVSAVSWLRHYCYVNTSLFYVNQPIYKKKSTKINREKPTRKNDGPEFTYRLLRTNFYPKLSFTLPGNVSF